MNLQAADDLPIPARTLEEFLWIGRTMVGGHINLRQVTRCN